MPGKRKKLDAAPKLPPFTPEERQAFEAYARDVRTSADAIGLDFGPEGSKIAALFLLILPEWASRRKRIT